MPLDFDLKTETGLVLKFKPDISPNAHIISFLRRVFQGKNNKKKYWKNYSIFV